MQTEGAGARLTAVARRWADEIGQDYEVVASILYRFARGDYYGEPDPNLAYLLAGADRPVQLPEREDARPREEYIEAGITESLQHHDPPIDVGELAEFCRFENIPCPSWISGDLNPEPRSTAVCTTPMPRLCPASAAKPPQFLGLAPRPEDQGFRCVQPRGN